MTTTWQSFDFMVEMPHLAPGEKLSEVEFLKVLAARQWQAIADLLGCPAQDIASDANDRLYGSLLNVELAMGEGSFDRFGEGARVFLRNRVNVYADRFVEGFFAIDDQPIAEGALEGVRTRKDLASTGLSWAYMTNVFIARMGGNTRLKVYKPAGIESLPIPKLERAPEGIDEHARVQSTGEVEALDEAPGLPLPTRRTDPIVYDIVPESDLNGAGLLYFARYVAMLNYGERRFLGEHLERPLSSDLNTCLSTEHRRIVFFANAGPEDRVQIFLRARLLPPGPSGEERRSAPWRTPLRLEFCADLYRASDKALMASSRVRKALNVPGFQKSVLLEAERLLRALGVGETGRRA